jgi:RNA polymerase sigma-70 factor (ECF subfamily)
MLNVARSSAVSGIGDPELLAMAADGNADAFDALLSGRLDRLYRMAFSITRSEADARDATQTACVQAWRELPRLRDRSRLDPWLSQILINSCRMLLRGRRRGSVRELSMDDPDRPLPGQGPFVAAASDQFGEADAIRAAFERLDPSTRTLLALHYVEGQPLAEIARSMGQPVGTIKWRLSNARRALEHALKAEQR